MSDPAISPAGLKIVKLLVGNAPKTVAEIEKLAGVTRTAVIEQLNELTAAGFVERATERLSGRGRPHNLYRATTSALTALFPGNQHLVAPAVWHAIRDIGGDSLVKKVLKTVSRDLADHYKAKITAKKPAERLRQFIELLAAEGGLADALLTERGQPALRKRSCPFISMVDPQRSVCFIDLEMISDVVGHPVRQVASRHDGDPCCTFEIIEDQ